MHEYFVSYSYSTYNQGSGFGNGTYEIDTEITGMKVISDLANYIKKQLNENFDYEVKGGVVILYFQKIN
jgi:hypothetical protein